MYIIAVRRITSGELLKQRKGLCIAGGWETLIPSSSRFSLTMPAYISVSGLGFRKAQPLTGQQITSCLSGTSKAKSLSGPISRGFLALLPSRGNPFWFGTESGNGGTVRGRDNPWCYVRC